MNTTVGLTGTESWGGQPSSHISDEPINSRDAGHRRIGNRIVPKAVYDGLFCESHAAKIWRVAQDFLNRDSTLAEFPEHVPSDGPNRGHYNTKPWDFWTCSFLPGCLYALLERRKRYPRCQPYPKAFAVEFHDQLLALCRAWSAPLHRNALRTNTHDVGFMMAPLRKDWELTGNQQCFDSVVKAAYNLASRYNEKTAAIRSWDQAISSVWHITDMTTNFFVIIDSMCSGYRPAGNRFNSLMTWLLSIGFTDLDLLFYVGHYIGDTSLVSTAVTHAKTMLRMHVRPDFSTSHVANLDPNTGELKWIKTHQGYSDDSCWSRGQAWSMLGFAQTYIWTRDPEFLNAAISLSNYFIDRLSSASYSHRYIPPWDFDAPLELDGSMLRDASAGMVAANALLLLHQILQGNSPYLETVFRIVDDTLDFCLSKDVASFIVDEGGRISVDEGLWDAILMHATANNNENALVRYGDHGLIYADYYFLELGNKLLQMGFL